MSKDLFEDIKGYLQLDFVSDIRNQRHRKELMELIQTTPAENYTANQWLTCLFISMDRG